MTTNDLLRALGEIDDTLIEDAMPKQARQDPQVNSPARKALSAASFSNMLSEEKAPEPSLSTKKKAANRPNPLSGLLTYDTSLKSDNTKESIYSKTDKGREPHNAEGKDEVFSFLEAAANSASAQLSSDRKAPSPPGESSASRESGNGFEKGKAISTNPAKPGTPQASSKKAGNGKPASAQAHTSTDSPRMTSSDAAMNDPMLIMYRNRAKAMREEEAKSRKRMKSFAAVAACLFLLAGGAAYFRLRLGLDLFPAYIREYLSAGFGQAYHSDISAQQSPTIPEINGGPVSAAGQSDGGQASEEASSPGNDILAPAGLDEKRRPSDKKQHSGDIPAQSEAGNSPEPGTDFRAYEEYSNSAENMAADEEEADEEIEDLRDFHDRDSVSAQNGQYIMDEAFRKELESKAVEYKEQAASLRMPFVNCGSPSEAAAIAGFTLQAPMEIGQFKRNSIRAIQNDLIELSYTNKKGEEILLRKSRDSAEISGNIEEYENDYYAESEEIPIHIRSDKNGAIHAADWWKENFTFSITTEASVIYEDDLPELLKQIS